VRVVDADGLAKIRAELLSYANAVGALKTMPTSEQLQAFFAQSNFTREKFVDSFTKSPKRK